MRPQAPRPRRMRLRFFLGGILALQPTTATATAVSRKQSPWRRKFLVRSLLVHQPARLLSLAGPGNQDEGGLNNQPPPQNRKRACAPCKRMRLKYCNPQWCPRCSWYVLIPFNDFSIENLRILNINKLQGQAWAWRIIDFFFFFLGTLCFSKSQFQIWTCNVSSTSKSFSSFSKTYSLVPDCKRWLSAWIFGDLI